MVTQEFKDTIQEVDALNVRYQHILTSILNEADQMRSQGLSDAEISAMYEHNNDFFRTLRDLTEEQKKLADKIFPTDFPFAEIVDDPILFKTFMHLAATVYHEGARHTMDEWVQSLHPDITGCNSATLFETAEDNDYKEAEILLMLNVIYTPRERDDFINSESFIAAIQKFARIAHTAKNYALVKFDKQWSEDTTVVLVAGSDFQYATVVELTEFMDSDYLDSHPDTLENHVMKAQTEGKSMREVLQELP